MISRVSDAEIEARRARQRRVAAYRAAKRAAKTEAAINRRVKPDEPQARQQDVSEVLNIFRREYDLLTEGEQIAFEKIVRAYVVGKVSLDEWRNVTKAIRANYRASLPSEPPIGGWAKPKDRWVPPPQGW
jgi:hypothetical protein